MLSIILLLLMLAKGLSAAMHSVYLGMLCTVLVSQSQFSPGLTNHSKVLIIVRPPDAGVAVLPGLGVGAVEVTGHGGHAEAGLAVLGQSTFKQTQCKYIANIDIFHLLTFLSSGLPPRSILAMMAPLTPLPLLRFFTFRVMSFMSRACSVSLTSLMTVLSESRDWKLFSSGNFSQLSRCSCGFMKLRMKRIYLNNFVRQPYLWGKYEVGLERIREIGLHMVLIVQFVQRGLSYVNMPESIKCKTFVNCPTAKFK